MKLALGTAQFGGAYGVTNQIGRLTQDDINGILALAGRLGVDMLDTAIGYGDSEDRIGASPVRGFKIVTKLPPLPSGIDDARTWCSAHIQESIGRLRYESLYGVLLHRAEDWFGPHGGAIQVALAEAKQRGLIQKAGVSIYGPEILMHVVASAKPDLVQAPLNVLDRRLSESGWLGRLVDAGAEVHARSVFLQGLLLLQLEDLTRKFSPYVDPLRAWRKALDARALSPLEACLHFVSANPLIARVVVGVDSQTHLEALGRVMASSVRQDDIPVLIVEDQRLMNPSLWRQL